MKHYNYQGSKVHIPPRAEVLPLFRPGIGAFEKIVQAAINEISPWKGERTHLETFTLPREIGARIVALHGTETPVWGRDLTQPTPPPYPLPYLALRYDDPRNRASFGTLELTGTTEKPQLLGAYQGEYVPPQPWMHAATNVIGGRDGCVDFWMWHAFIVRDQAIEPAQPAYWYAPR